MESPNVFPEVHVVAHGLVGQVQFGDIGEYLAYFTGLVEDAGGQEVVVIGEGKRYHVTTTAFVPTMLSHLYEVQV